MSCDMQAVPGVCMSKIHDNTGWNAVPFRPGAVAFPDVDAVVMLFLPSNLSEDNHRRAERNCQPHDHINHIQYL